MTSMYTYICVWFSEKIAFKYLSFEEQCVHMCIQVLFLSFEVQVFHYGARVTSFRSCLC